MVTGRPFVCDSPIDCIIASQPVSRSDVNTLTTSCSIGQLASGTINDQLVGWVSWVSWAVDQLID